MSFNDNLVYGKGLGCGVQENPTWQIPTDTDQQNSAVFDHVVSATGGVSILASPSERASQAVLFSVLFPRGR